MQHRNLHAIYAIYTIYTIYTIYRMSTKVDPVDNNFTVFIRLPFPRGDFVDPPPASLPKRNPLSIC